MRALFRFMDWPLRAKMAALLVVASLLPLGVETWINIREARERLLANTAALLAARGDQLLGQLDTFHRGYQRSLDGVARLPRVRDFYEARPEDRDRLQVLARAAMEVWPASDPNIRGVALLDLSGTVQLATEDPLLGLDLSFHRYVQEALRGVALISDVHLMESPAGDAPTIAYLAPVFGLERELIGVVAFWVRATALWEVMKASNELAGPQSFAVLFDHHGIRIGHTFSEEIVFHPGGRLDPTTVEALVAERRFAEKTRALLEDVRPFPEQFDRARSESPDRGLFRGFAPVNQKWNYGVARRFETVPWTVFYMIPEQALHAQVAQMTRQKILFAAVIILVALLAATMFAAAILKPIDSLATATQSLADGHLAARVEAGHADELGRLGANFNSMAAWIEAQATALQKGREELELRVQERTAELAQTNRNLEVEITERQQAELTATQLAAIVECSFDAIIGKDLHGIVTSWNAGAERMFGYAADEMIGRSITLLIPPGRHDDEERILARMRRGESMEHFETVRVRKDGSLVDVSVTVSPIKDANGEIIGASKVARDITERKRAEVALRESEERFRAYVEQASDSMFVHDFSGRFTAVNRQACTSLGYSREELLRMSVFDVENDFDLPKAQAIWSQIKPDEAFTLAGHQRRKDGSTFPVEIRFGCFDMDGQRYYLGLARDMTERNNAELALREKDAQLHATDRRLAEIVQGMTEACFALDEEWHFTFVNDRGETLLRHHREQMLGRTIWEVFSKLVGTPMEAHYRRAMAERVPVAFEVFSPIAERWLDIRLFPTPEGLAAFLLDIHARKLGEEALRASQARLNSTLSAGSIGTWTWDIVHDRLSADEFTARMFSIEVDAAAKGLPAEAYLQAVMEEDRASVAAGLASAIQTCGYYDIEYRVRQKDGELRWLQAKGRVEGDAAGNALNFHGAVMDITERKRTEGHFRRLVDSNAQGVIFWNTKGEITRANDAFLRIVGYTREDLEAGRVGWAALTPPEFAHLDQRSLEELAAKGVCTPFEKEYLRKDGSRVPILIGAATFEDSPDEGVCFVLDITERKQTDQALRASEEYFRFLNDLGEATRTLADPAQIMAVTARMLGEHLRASRCAYADVEQDGEQFTILHDYTDGCASTVGQYQLSLFGARAVARLHGGQTLIIRDVEAELLPGEGADMFNAIGIKAIICCPLVKEGGLRAMMAVHQATPRDWKAGEIAMVQDVVERCWATIERRTAEEEIRQLNATLEHRVIERTAQLESANKELEAFSYSVSHDLRAPLRAVDGFSQAVLEDYGPQLPEEGQRYLQTIREGAQRMGTLIDDLLTFSRLSRLPLTKQTVDAQRQVRETLDELMAGQDGRAIEIRLGELPPYDGDPALMKQVWVNLLSNALKYTGKREQAVVEIGATREQGATVYFVRDNGTGFDMRYAHKLFGVFQRLHRQEEFAGTGVGLAIVQRIIHRHGGRIWADAAPDRGATFYFTLEGETEL